MNQLKDDEMKGKQPEDGIQEENRQGTGHKNPWSLKRILCVKPDDVRDEACNTFPERCSRKQVSSSVFFEFEFILRAKFTIVPFETRTHLGEG